MIGYEVVTWL